MRITAKTPASSANLGPGFDVLGLALTLYDTLIIETGTDGIKLTVSGEGQGKLDNEPEKNLACRSVRVLYEKINVDTPDINIHMDNAVPLSRGLGSSSAAIVGALTAANVFSGANLSKEELFNMAVKIEGHADNVAAAVYGGLVIAYKKDEGYLVKKCRVAANLGVALLVPDEGLSTAKARAALPEEISRDSAVINIGSTALLMEALTTGDLSHFASAVNDALHQPWRRSLIADYDITERACYSAGAKGVALSGAGPTLIAFFDKADENSIKSNLENQLKHDSIMRRALFLDIDKQGSKVQEVR